MAKANFSESSFGFAYTHELVSLWWNHLIKAPYFPSTRKEGMKGGGYDVKLTTRGFVYCVQFKRSEWINSPLGREVKHISSPYWRFGIGGRKNKKGPDQHEALLALEEKGARVEYVVPKFIDRRFLDNFFIKKELREKVFRLKPSVVKKLPDDEKHFIVSDPSWTDVNRCSESVKFEGPYDWGEITENGFIDTSSRVVESFRGEKTIRDQLRDIGDEMISFWVEWVEYETSGLEPLRDYPRVADTPVLESSDVRSVRSFYLDNFEYDPVGTLREMSRVLLGAELFAFSEECDCCE